MQKWIFSGVLFISLILLGCQSQEPTKGIKVGAIAGPETELLEVARDVAKKKYDLDIHVVQFTDYTIPNAALADGSIDANMFQTIPYFDADVKARRFKLAIIGKTFIYPMAIYSKKVKNLNELAPTSEVAVPNDPSNEARALLLLQEAGLITLKPGVGALASTLDIDKNPKRLEIRPLDAAQLPRVLQDVALAVINTNYAVAGGLVPKRDGLFVEKKDSPYANVIVVREKDKDDPRFQQLVDALHSQEVVDKAEALFQGQAVKAW